MTKSIPRGRATTVYVKQPTGNRMTNSAYDAVNWSRVATIAFRIWMDAMDQGIPREQIRLKIYKAKAHVVTTTVYED